MDSVAEALFWGLLAHFVGDYLLQSDWMSAEKTKDILVALLHGAVYGLPFTVLLWVIGLNGWPGVAALGIIIFTHAAIDHWRLARYVCWAKNQLAPRAWRHPWDGHVSATGYHKQLQRDFQFEGWALSPDNRCAVQGKPDYMAVWLMIICDNTLHIAVNSIVIALAVRGR